MEPDKRNMQRQKKEEIKRLLKLGLTKRKIARAVSCSRNSIRIIEEELLSEAGAIPFVQASVESEFDSSWTSGVDWSEVRAEVHASTPLMVLWEELVASGKVPVQYPAFFKQYVKRYPKIPDATMRRVFKPGESCEIDYADGIDFYDPATGEVMSTQLFMGVLCFSRYVYGEFTLSQKSEDFLSSHVRMFEFFKGVPEVVTPDNLKSAITKAHRYEPSINLAYQKCASHYEFAVLPARVATPQHKAIVERSIQIFQKWFYYRVRKTTFTSLSELNRSLRASLEIFNKKIHRIYKKSRLEMYEAERAHLKPLPHTPYVVNTHHRARLHSDCHLEFEGNYYSAPYIHREKVLDLWVSEKTIEITCDGTRVALHVRTRAKHRKFCTKPEHYPERHQAYVEATPKFLIGRSRSIGPECEKLTIELLEMDHPLRHLRRLQGILSLEKRYGRVLLENACKDANRFNIRNYKWIEAALKRTSQRVDLKQKTTSFTPKRGTNPYLRGQDLFSSLEPAEQTNTEGTGSNEHGTDKAGINGDEALWNATQFGSSSKRVH